MSVTYLSKQDEVLDEICRRHYGDRPGSVEQVLEANPGLAELGHRLPAGTRVLLPTIATSIPAPTVALWD